MAAKNKVEVIIAGKTYTIKGSESDEHIQKVANFVNKQMSKVIESNRTMSTSMIAVLTAINVTDDLYKANDEVRLLTNELDNYKTQANGVNKKYDNLKNEVIRVSDSNTELISNNASLKQELAKKEDELSRLKEEIEKLKENNKTLLKT